MRRVTKARALPPNAHDSGLAGPDLQLATAKNEPEQRPACDTGRSPLLLREAGVPTGLELTPATDELRACRPGERLTPA